MWLNSRCTAVYFNTISFRFTPLGIGQLAVLQAGKGGGAAEGQKLNRNKKYLFADDINTTQVHVGKKIQVTYTEESCSAELL